MRDVAREREYRVIIRSSVAGFVIAIGWLMIASEAFGIPGGLRWLAQVSFPIAFIPWGFSTTGWMTTLVFSLMTVGNALFYGVVALFVCRAGRILAGRDKR
jgi:hypothetical protein